MNQDAGVCQVTMGNGRICGKASYREWNGKCIFHANKHDRSDAIEAFKNDFAIKLRREIEDDKIDELDFTEYSFPNYSFDNIVLKKSVNFTKATFTDNISFKGSIFEGNYTKFTNTIFTKGALFNLSTFRAKETDFSNTKFLGETSFYKTLFTSRITNFQSSVFEVGCIFSDSFFNNNVYFLSSHFKGEKVVFENTHFIGKIVSFTESIFESIETDFTNTVFEGKAFFDECTFRNNIHFSHSKEIYFSYSYLDASPMGFNLNPDLGIRYDRINKMMSIGYKMTHEHKSKLLSISSDPKYQVAVNELFRRSNGKMFIGAASIRDTKLLEPVSIKFQHINLSTVELRGTDIRYLHFIDVEWNELRRIRLWIPFKEKFHALYDEIIISTEKDVERSEIELTRHAYRQLKQNYEDNRNYYVADDFYFGEMEMARMKNTKWWKRHLFSWQVLYRWSSGYGQQWENSLFLITLFFLGLPLIFLTSGLQYLYSGNFYLADYWHALQYNFLTITFQKEISELYRPEIITRNLAIIESLIIPILATLFVLALRRRFKR